MSEEKMVVWLVVLVILGIFLFGGDPDITDSIIGLIQSNIKE